jgi:hypothetical protein
MLIGSRQLFAITYSVLLLWTWRTIGYEDNAIYGSRDYLADRCTACKAVIDAIEGHAEKFSVQGSKMLKPGVVEELVTGEELCRWSLGSTKLKCQYLVEEHEEVLVGSLRQSSSFDRAKLERQICHSLCENQPAR